MSTKETPETAEREANNTTPNIDPDEFKSGAARYKFKQCFSVFKENGEAQIGVYNNEIANPVREAWLQECMKDSSLAIEFIQLLYNAINKAE